MSDKHPDDPSKPPDEQRGVRRQRVLKEGRVLLSSASTLDCTIRDLTAEGAKLAFVTPPELPPTFALLMISAATITPAQLLWQRGLSVGIAFTGPARPAPPRSVVMG